MHERTREQAGLESIPETARVGADVTTCGRLFRRRLQATGKARSPTVMNCVQWWWRWTKSLAVVGFTFDDITASLSLDTVGWETGRHFACKDLASAIHTGLEASGIPSVNWSPFWIKNKPGKQKRQKARFSPQYFADFTEMFDNPCLFFTISIGCQTSLRKTFTGCWGNIFTVQHPFLAANQQCLWR